MQKYEGQLLRKFEDGITGIVAASVPVVVYDYPALTLATIYSEDNTSSTPIAGSTLLTDVDGKYFFFAEDGEYQLDIDGGSQQLIIQMLDVGGLDGKISTAVADQITATPHNSLTNRTDPNAHPISAITGLQTALDGKVGVVVGKELSDNNYTDAEQTKLAGIETGAQNNTASNVGASGVGLFKQKTASNLEFKKIIAGSNVTITEQTDTITITSTGEGGGGTTSHTDLTNRDAADQHPISAITGLQTALDGKSNIGHTHVIADVTGLQTALDGKAPTSHTHTIANVTGLQAELDSKEDVGVAQSLIDDVKLVERVKSKATLIADFVNNQFKVYESPYGQEPKQLTDVVTNTRASGATRNTPLGVETMGVDTLRIEYDGLTGEPLGALCEPAGVNLLFPSQDVTGYSLTRCTIAKSTTVFNRYGVFATELTVTADGSTYARKSTFTTEVGKYYCHSYEFRLADVTDAKRPFLSLSGVWIDGGVSKNLTWYKSTNTFAAATSAGLPAYYGLDFLDNGWARLWAADLCVTAVTDLNTCVMPWFQTVTTGDVFHYDQVQINEGTYPLNPIVTTTSSVATVTDATRSQFLSRFLNDNFSFMVDVTPTGLGSDGTNRLIAFAASDAAVGDQIGVDIDTNGTRLRYRCANFTAVQSWTPPDPATLAGRLRIVGTVNKTTGDVKLWVNGTSVINTTTTNTANISAFRFVKYGIPTVATGNMGKQVYREVMVFPSGLSDAESLALSAPVGV